MKSVPSRRPLPAAPTPADPLCLHAPGGAYRVTSISACRSSGGTDEAKTTISYNSRPIASITATTFAR